MKKILQTLLFITVVSIASCTKEDPAPANPVVGEWLLSKFTLSNLTADFSNFEGANGPGLYSEDSYELIINADFTYSRTVTFNGGLNELKESGDWESDGEDIFLDPDGTGNGFLEEFTLVEVDEKDLSLKSDITISLFSDAFYDTYSSTQIDSLFNLPDADWESVRTTFYLPAAATITYEFDKTND